MPILGARGGASSRGLGQFTGSPTAPTSPVAGYHLWLDAANAGSFTYSSGSVVSQWTDRSANAFTFTTAGTTNQPSRTGTQNGKPTVVFDGNTADYLKSTTTPATWKYLHDGSGSTMFIVIKSTEPTTYSSANWIMSTMVGDIGFNVKLPTGSSSQLGIEISDGVANTYLENIQNIPNTGHNVYTFKLDPNNSTNNSKLPMYINGGSVLNPTFVYNWTGASTGNPDSTLYLGTGYDGALVAYPQYAFSGEIAEIITYKSVLSDSDRIANINYLKAKWGI